MRRFCKALFSRAACGFAVIGLSACASSSTGTDESTDGPLGAWVSSEEAMDCATKPMTYFSSDGTVLIFLSREGPLHSFGQWEMSGSTLMMTHNDFPTPASGLSGSPVSLEVLTLSSTEFVTRNVKGDTRTRTRCTALKIDPNLSHVGH